MTTGLIFIAVSVMQMLRGSMVIFSALLTMPLRHRKLRGFEWFGVIVCCTAMVLVGLSCILGSDSRSEYGAGYQVLGCGLVIASQVVQALQIVIEESLLADVKLPPLIVVGMEGVWGTLMCIFSFIPIFYFIPGNDHEHYEDTYDTFYKVFTNLTIGMSSLVYFFSILFLNIGGMIVTSELTAVHRTIFEALRTMFIWIVSLIIYYAWRKDKGEKWTNWSYMELCGFLLLVFSMLLYNRVIRLTCFFKYPNEKEEGETKASPSDSPDSNYQSNSPKSVNQNYMGGTPQQGEYVGGYNQDWTSNDDPSKPLLSQ